MDTPPREIGKESLYQLPQVVKRKAVFIRIFTVVSLPAAHWGPNDFRGKGDFRSPPAAGPPDRGKPRPSQLRRVEAPARIPGAPGAPKPLRRAQGIHYRARSLRQTVQLRSADRLLGPRANRQAAPEAGRLLPHRRRRRRR